MNNLNSNDQPVSANASAQLRCSAYVGLDELQKMLDPIESLRVGMRLLAAMRLMRTLDREHLQRLSDACITEERSMPNAALCDPPTTPHRT